jgi:hypothetical protein
VTLLSRIVAALEALEVGDVEAAVTILTNLERDLLETA